MEMTRSLENPVVGKKYFLVDIGNRARRRGGEQRTCSVINVGRKYFTVAYEQGLGSVSVIFHRKDFTQKSDYSANYRLYPDQVSWEEEIEWEKWQKTFRRFTDCTGNKKVSAEQYRAAALILDIDLLEDD